MSKVASKRFSRKNWQKTLVLINNGKGQNPELAEAITQKFAGTTFHKWRVFAIGPQAIPKASYNFKIEMPQSGVIP